MKDALYQFEHFKAECGVVGVRLYSWCDGQGITFNGVCLKDWCSQ
jgi:hypothetical protein